MARLIDVDALMQFPIRLNHYDRVNGNEHYVFGVEAVLEYAENLPTIDVEPVRHGKWEHGMQCPFCKQIDTAKPNYCPNCGAKMQGGNDEA